MAVQLSVQIHMFLITRFALLLLIQSGLHRHNSGCCKFSYSFSFLIMRKTWYNETNLPNEFQLESKYSVGGREFRGCNTSWLDMKVAATFSVQCCISSFKARARNANTSLYSSIILVVGLCAPWPALVSIRIIKGLVCLEQSLKV